MARSQDTFSKKENEKKKQQKKKEKEEKREERKANSQKGKSFEDMLAYVDEYGVISSTPPDPNAKRKEVNLDDIQLGAHKEEAVEAADLVRTGIITFFNEAKGYGFIRDLKSQESIFVHINGLVDPVKENDNVTFAVEMGKKGLNAISVTKVKK